MDILHHHRHHHIFPINNIMSNHCTCQDIYHPHHPGDKIRNAHWWWSSTFVGLRWQEAPAAARLLKPHTGLQTHYHPHHPHHPHHTSWCTMYTHKQINILTRKLIDLVKRIKQVTKYHNASLDSRGLIFRGYCHPAYHWMFKSDVTRGCISGMRKLPSSNGASLASGRGSVSPSGGRQDFLGSELHSGISQHFVNPNTPGPQNGEMVWPDIETYIILNV